ncbi:hypothetical protein ACIS_00238 [Anaplasma centrale str. Israel]|uniref:Uncharacterized protein n=1 Tax=Anaplasma centrale (strain Israel) TaxID=574556 RepID=D1ATN2_ANACI|nr:hypothetical protein ACIS_00238 [Anaplasma centrale str. Israel]
MQHETCSVARLSNSCTKHARCQGREFMCRRQDSYELVGAFAGKVYNRFILTRPVVARFAQFAYLRLCFGTFSAVWNA